MERLEISVINSSVCEQIVDYRIDADTYKKEYLCEEKILQKLKSKPIEEIITSIQNFGAYSLCNEINFTEDGIPFLMTQNVRDNFINWDNVRHVDKRSHELLHKSHCKKNQVLITMAGEYLGKSAVYDKDFVCSSNQAIAKLTLKDDYYPYYVSTFINCKYGQNQISRFRTRTGQPNINMGLIKKLLIPYMSKDFSMKIERSVLEVQQILKQANNMYNEATIILENDLGIDMSSCNTSSITTKTFSECFSKAARLDAEYFQPKCYKVLEQLNAKETLGNLCNLYDKTFIPNDDADYQYIELANIGRSGEIDGVEVTHGSELPTRARRLVRKGQIIVSSVEGSIESCALITDEYDGAICSTGFYVIDSNNYNSETLLVLMKSSAIQFLLKRACSGTILPNISKDEFLSIPLPAIESGTQEEIKRKISEVYAYRNKGINLLETIKESVEMAIEQGEKVAIKWLDSKIK